MPRRLILLTKGLPAIEEIMRKVVCLCLMFLASAAWSSYGGDSGEIANSFRFTAESKSVLEAGETKKEIVTNTEIRYTWTRKRQDRTLAFDLVKIRAVDDGQESLDVTMSRKKIRAVVKGELKETLVEDGTPAQQAMLKDGFESPICIVRVDETGKEVKRTIVAGAGAKIFIDNGQIANALIFHPPFFKDKEKWEAPAELPLGNGGYARGTFSYQRKAADKQKFVFDVAGVLASKKTKKLKDLTITEEWRQDVKGEQVFDLARQEWTSGKLAIDVKMDFTPDKGSATTAKGTIKVTFAYLPKKK